MTQPLHTHIRKVCCCSWSHALAVTTCQNVYSFDWSVPRIFFLLSIYISNSEKYSNRRTQSTLTKTYANAEILCHCPPTRINQTRVRLYSFTQTHTYTYIHKHTLALNELAPQLQATNLLSLFSVLACIVSWLIIFLVSPLYILCVVELCFPPALRRCRISLMPDSAARWQ